MNVIESTGERLSYAARVKIGVRHVASRIRHSASDAQHLILTEDGQALGRELARLAREVTTPSRKCDGFWINAEQLLH